MDKLILMQAKAYYLRKVLDKVEHQIELEQALRSKPEPEPVDGQQKESKP